MGLADSGSSILDPLYHGARLDDDDIAIVGFAAQLPQDAETTAGFWKMLYEGRNATTDVPKDRINMDGFYNPNGERPDTCNVRKANFVKADPAAFDAAFFSIQPIEAESMDPQQRLLLETSYQALENAGILIEHVSGTDTGVFVAASNRDYEVMLLRDSEQTPKYMGTGIGTSLLSNRISWAFNLRGPSVSVDTACSGSLTALHFGVQSLQRGESSLALVGGVSYILLPDASMTQLSTLGFLSPDGLSYAFDSRANGYAKGEGAGVVVLKRLSDAIRDQDTIRAIIRATAINQDGRTPGITQPSISAQTANIQKAYRSAGLNMDDTGYFESHGTGTSAGDPIEAEAIYRAFRRSPENPLHIGSLKANIGHLEAGAGVAALIKSILILENGIIVPNANYENTNPNIPDHEWGVKFLREPQPFPTGPGNTRRISVNNFGYGGSNAHAIVDDALHYLQSKGLQGKHRTISHPALVEGLPSTNGHSKSSAFSESDEVPMVLAWSANDEASLDQQIERHKQHFANVSLADPAAERKYLRNAVYTLSARRSNLSWKAASVVWELEDLQEPPSMHLVKLRSSSPPAVSFIFTGQGAQWAGMAHGLDKHPAFARSMRLSEKLLTILGCEWSLQDELAKDRSSSCIDSPEISQPVCTAIQIGLCDLLRAWNIRPVAVVGHSSGEIAAAYCIGALSQAAAIKAAYLRGKVVSEMQQSKSRSGGMLAVALSEDKVKRYIDEANLQTQQTAASGCINSPVNTTLTGDIRPLEAIQAALEKEGIFARRLPVNVAYHSFHMESVAARYRDALGELSMNDLIYDEQPLMFSSVTGQQISPAEVSNADYWVRNLVSKVEFARASQALVAHLLCGNNKSGADVLVEIGPHSALQRPIKDILEAFPAAKNFSYQPSLTKSQRPLIAVASLAARLRCCNAPVDLVSVCAPSTPLQDLQMLIDLPKYSFNQKRHWTESRFSRNHRFREFSRHELLGAREQDWNPLKPRWRSLIRIAEHPWLHDHKFGSTALFPASGMLVMALEGARQLYNNDAAISGYSFRNVHFAAAFPVPIDSDVMEAQLHFQPCNDADAKQPTSHNFSLYGLVGETWTEVCRGAIEVTSSPTLPVPWHQGTKLHRLLETNKTWSVHAADEFYEKLSNMGYTLGSPFQGLSELRTAGTAQATATACFDEWVAKVKAPELMPHVIHPIDLDAVLQTSVVALSQGGNNQIPVVVPTYIHSMWVSQKLLRRKAKDKMQLVASRTNQGFREHDFDFAVIDEQDLPVVCLERYRTTAINSVEATRESVSAKKLNYFVRWRPDPDLLDGNAANRYCKANVQCEVPSKEGLDTQELIAFYSMHEAISNLTPDDIASMPDYLQKYMAWINHHFDNDKLQELRQQYAHFEDLFGTDMQRRGFLDRFACQSGEANMIVIVARNLLDILRGTSDALSLLYTGDVPVKYYQSISFEYVNAIVKPYVDLLGHKNPSLDILEIGAGTGSATTVILETLTQYTNGNSIEEQDIPRYNSYCYTDISAAFFDGASSRLSKYPGLSFAVLDVEKDPIGQGFTQKYDLIVCGAVLHATADLKRTLTNVRSLLKPGGKLLMIEPMLSNPVRISFIFGLLQGWWMSSEPYRQWGPCVTQSQWNDLLLDTGFSGIDAYMPDFEAPGEVLLASFISSAVDNKPALQFEASTPCDILISKSSTLQLKLAQHVTENLRQNSMASPRVIEIDDASTWNHEGAHCLVLLGMECPFFDSVEDASLGAFRKLISTAASIVWVKHVDGLASSDPRYQATTGITRNLSSEHPEVSFTELSVDGSAPINVTARIIGNVFSKKAKQSPVEPELRSLGSTHLIEIPRLVADPVSNSYVQKATGPQQPTMQPFGENVNRALELGIATPGILDSLHFLDDTIHDRTIQDAEVEVRVMASGMNFKDLLIASGVLAGSTLGFDFAGVVTRTGPDSPFNTGDKVCGCTVNGSHKAFVRTDSSAVIRLPEDMPFTEGAALPIVYATAYYSLVVLANLREGESILIHSAAGGVGQAAIQLANRLGARIFATAGSVEKRKLIARLYNIPADHIFDSRSTNFVQRLKACAPDGVDVILNSLSGEKQVASWECVAPLGRFIELGKVDFERSQRGLPMTPFLDNVAFFSVSLDIVMTKAKPLMRKIMRGVAELLFDASNASNPIKAPYPVTVFDVGEIQEAFRYMQAGKHSGKIVIEMNAESMVPALPSTKPKYNFEGAATYVIAGGTGGLGRTIITWMVSRGARNFLLLSRSGGRGAAAELIAELSKDGVNVLAPPCDISREQEVQAALDSIQGRLPSIKGCIQSTMVLKDGLFKDMTAESFNAVLRPKVAGTLVLEKLLPRDMDFLVLLSSVASMTGSRGQANYAAANAFLDGFARKRAAQGQHCISINLGSILSVGYAGENNLSAWLRETGFEGVSEKEFLALLDYACNPDCPAARDPDFAQLVSGLAAAETLPAEHFHGVYWTSKPMFQLLLQYSTMRSNLAKTTGDQAAKERPAVLLAAAADQAAAEDVVEHALVDRFARLMAVPVSEIDVRRPVGSFGIDSLVSLELRYWIAKELKAEISVGNIMEAAGLAELSTTVVEKTALWPPGGAPDDVVVNPVRHVARGAQVLT